MPRPTRWDIMTGVSMRVAISARGLTLATIAIIVGVIHRAAQTSPWADDVVTTADPEWLQMAAPGWHAVLDGSTSIAALLTRLVDPLTAASGIGDARAIAGVTSGLAAAALLTALRSAAVPDVIACLLCLALAAKVLPLSAVVAPAHALQTLAAAAALAVCAR